MQQEKKLKDWSTEDLKRFLKTARLTPLGRKTIEDELTRREN